MKPSSCADLTGEAIDLRAYLERIGYDGPVAPDAVARVARALLDMGCYEISLGDTVGRATPEGIAAMLEAVTAPEWREASPLGWF